MLSEVDVSITVSLSREAEEAVRRRAAVAGKAVDQYVSDLVQEAVTRPTLSEILAPVHEEVRNSGMSDQELDGLLKSELDAYRAERRTQKGA